MRVAESIVILGPIVHVGWASACDGAMTRQLRAVPAAKGSTARREPDARNIRRSFTQVALEDRRVFRVNRDELSGCGTPGDELASRDQGLLVCQREHLSRAQRTEGCAEAGRSDKGVEHHVSFGEGRKLGNGISAVLDLRLGQERGSLLGSAFLCKCDHPNLVLARLLREKFVVAIG